MDGNLTYIWTDEGWLYLAVVIDLFNREVVGWSIRSKMTAEIVIGALTMAWFRKKPAPGLIHHSDRGSRPVCKRRLSGPTVEVWNELLDEPQGKLVGQRAHGKLLQ